MKVEKFLVALFCSTIIGLNGWILLEIVNLKVQVATLAVRIEQVSLAQQ